MIPVVAIVGRPNVGKSTLFNRFRAKRDALVAPEPGMTRDRHYGIATWDEKRFFVVDTGGLEFDEKTEIDKAIRSQTDLAIDEADIILCVFDARQGPTTIDAMLVDRLRRSTKPTVYVANKVDGAKLDVEAAAFHELGISDIISVSAEHGRGMDDLIAHTLTRLDDKTSWTTDSNDLSEPNTNTKIALVGRPNAGKSALLNRLSNTDRAIVSATEGTTRDPIDVEFETPLGRFTVVDTAGIRRKKRSSSHLEQLAVLRALRAAERADVVCLLVSADRDVSFQDARIATTVTEYGRALVLVASKSDLFVRDKRHSAANAHHGGDVQAFSKKSFRDQIEQRLGFINFAPMVYVSAENGSGLDRLLQAVRKAKEQHNRRISTAEVNRFISATIERRPPPQHHGKPVNVLYATQASCRPPTFVLNLNVAASLDVSYQRFITNQLRMHYGFSGTPVRILVRGKQRKP